MDERIDRNEVTFTMSSSPGDAARIARYRKAVHRFDSWVESHLLPSDRGWSQSASVDGYFSLVLYANAVGRRDWAGQALKHLRTRFMDGTELVQASNRDGMRTYMPSWVAWAAHEAECFELSNLLLEGIGTYQDEMSGGFFGGRSERDGKQGRIDFDSTTMSIIALSRGGRIGRAEKGADFLVKLWAAQPACDERFQTAWREPEGLQGVEAGENTVLQWALPKQSYYKVGLFVQALLNAYGSTGRRAYRDVATEVYDHAVAKAEDLWTNTISHKMCWAAVTLHHVTGRSEYLNDACRFADHLLTVQHEDGTFNYPEVWPEFPPPKWEMIPNASCQFGLWIVRVLRALESRSEVAV